MIRAAVGCGGFVPQATDSANLRLAGPAHRAETLLELVDATFGIDELLLPSEERMRVRADADGDDFMFHVIDDLDLVRGLGRAGDKAGTSGHIDENHGMIFGMQIFFHAGAGFAPRSNAAGARK